MEDTKSAKPEPFNALALRGDRREAHEKACALARGAVESKNLVDLKRSCEEFESEHLSWRAGHLRVLPLAESARVGWGEGVEFLAKSGCDPNRSDDGRAGWSGGEAPLAEAIARGDFDMAELLSGFGARVEPLLDMVWAASFSASRRGLAAGLEALSWLRGHGLNEWGDDEASRRSQSIYLFAGSLGSTGWDEQSRQGWEEALFKGADLSLPGARDCAWHMLYGGVGRSPDGGAWLAKRFVDSAPDREKCALGMLRWGLEGAPWLAAAGLDALVASDAGAAYDALVEACSEKSSLCEISTPMAELESKAFEMAWSKFGEDWLAKRMDWVAPAAKALAGGRSGLGASLLASGAEPLAISKLWRSMGVSAFSGSGEDGERRRAGLGTLLLASGDPQSTWEFFKPWMEKSFPMGLVSALAAVQSEALGEILDKAFGAKGIRL